MKNIKLFYTSTLLLSGLTLLAASPSAMAQRSRNQRVDASDILEEKISPDTLGTILNALDNQKLRAETQDGRFLSPTLNLSNIGASTLSGALTLDGIPGPRGEDSQMSIDDVVAKAYTSVQMIELVLEERKSYQMGPRVLFLENGIRSVLSISGKRENEEALRETLNRGLDIMSLVLPITGAAPEASALWATNFYRSVMILAAGLQNNDMQKVLRIGNARKINEETKKNGEEKFDNYNTDLSSGAERYVSALTSAKYGQTYANLLYRFSTTPGTRAAKAVLLMRLLGYLGHDLNEDLARRSEGVGRTITDIYRLENDPIYASITNALRRGQSPSSQELATFRSRVYAILTKLPERLGKAVEFAESKSP